MAIVVEPVVTREKLSELLAEGAEFESLDYKSECDLRDNAATVEFAKDFGAMQAKAGYIVVGVDSTGVPTGKLTPGHAALFDEATLRSKMLQYFAEPLEILIGRHELEFGPVVVVYVGPHPLGFAICTGIGQYNVGRESKVIFRDGDVLVRHGSASERWRPPDIPAMLQRVVRREKESWRGEFAADLAKMGVAATGQQLAASPAAAFDWRVDEETFRATLIELLRRHDYIPMRLLADAIIPDVRLLAGPDPSDELATLLDRLTCMAALAVTLADAELFSISLSALGNAYDVGFESERASGRSPTVTAARLWLATIERVFGIGALATRRSQWSAVRALALRPGNPAGGTSRYRSWLRHALTMGSQAGLFESEEGGQRVRLSLLSLARTHVARMACLRPDIPSGDERVLDTLCQFDMLSGLAAVAETKAAGMGVYYPNFARFYSHRTTPILERLLRDAELRRAIEPSGDDQFLADALREINKQANNESWSYGGWDGYISNEIEKFLKDHPPKGTGPEVDL